MWKICVALFPVAFCGLAARTAQEWADLSIFIEPSGDPPGGSRIIGGTEVEPNSVPYQAALFIRFARGKSFCGGSLISESYILTAAHCMDKAKSVEVFLGAHDIRKNETSQYRVTCEDISVHPEWNYQKLQNDIALIKLPEPVTLNKYISPVSLARSGTFAESMGVLSGWGKTTDASKVSDVLNSVNLAVLENSNCGIYYKELIQETHVCTSGAEIKGGCNGDSGGPLVVDGQQVGIVSFGSNTCTKGYPTVFTRITEFSSWIAEITDIEI
ncbi:brachyurin-like [Euwallacea similis]|uniref:brachyurin-like n=1 Tax=Euwallacea similis TaxID=1736056 RepID=UPI00344F96CE